MLSQEQIAAVRQHVEDALVGVRVAGETDKRFNVVADAIGHAVLAALQGVASALSSPPVEGVASSSRKKTVSGAAQRAKTDELVDRISGDDGGNKDG